MEHSASTQIDFQKDFEDHMRELASEISGLHTKSPLTFADDYETLSKMAAGVDEDDDFYNTFGSYRF